MAEQDPTNLNNDKFTLNVRDGVAHPTDILASPQTHENQTITQTIPTSPTLPHTQNDAIINAEASPSSLLITPDDTVTPQDTTLTSTSTAHNVSRSSMTPQTAFTLNPDPTSTTANSNQASKNLSQLPGLGAKPVNTQQTRSHNDSGSMEAFGYVHEGRSYELEIARDEITNLKQKLEKAEVRTTSLNQEFNKGKTEITSLKQKLEKAEVRTTSLNQELDKGKTEITSLKQKLETAEVRTTSLNQELDKGKTEITSLKQKLETAEVRTTSLNQELDKGKTEITSLKQKLEKAEVRTTSLNQELDKGKTDITNLKQKVKILANEKSDLERTVDTVAADKLSLKKQVSELDSTNQSLERERKILKMELEQEKDRRRGKNDDLEGLEITVQEQKQSMVSQNVELRKLQQEAEGKDQSINHANEENTRLENELNKLQQKSKTQTGQVKGVEKKLADAQREITKLKKDHDRTMKELQQNVERLTLRVQNQPKTKLNEMKQEFAETLKINAQMEIELETLRTEMSGLEGELRKVQARADKAQEKLKAQGPNNKDTKKAGTAGEKIKVPHENPIEEEEGARDVPIVEHHATSVSNEPAVTVMEEPKLPSTEAGAKERESKAEISELTGPQWENGHTSEATESGTGTNTNALEKADDHHKQKSQEVDPFTEAHVSVEHPATSNDKEHDDSISSVCSTTELSLDDRTPRALRRPLGQEGIHSRAQSTATEFSVTKCEKWIHRTSNYVEKSMQTDSVKLMGEMGVQTENVPVKLTNGEGLSAEKDQGPEVEKVNELGAKKDQDPEVEKGSDLSAKKDQSPEVEKGSVPKSKEDQNPEVEKGSEPKSKEEIPEPHQIRWCCRISSFLLLLMLLFYLGICCSAWSSWSATTTERNLWKLANNAITHRGMLHDNGSSPPSALSEHFANYAKM